MVDLILRILIDHTLDRCNALAGKLADDCISSLIDASCGKRRYEELRARMNFHGLYVSTLRFSEVQPTCQHLPMLAREFEQRCAP